MKRRLFIYYPAFCLILIRDMITEFYPSCKSKKKLLSLGIKIDGKDAIKVRLVKITLLPSNIPPSPHHTPYDSPPSPQSPLRAVPS